MEPSGPPLKSQEEEIKFDSQLRTAFMRKKTSTHVACCTYHLQRQVRHPEL